MNWNSPLGFVFHQSFKLLQDIDRMTNVMALRVRPPSKRKSGCKEYVICCADSQSTYSAGQSKAGSSQKLVRIGNNFVMGTGNRDMIVGIEKKLLEDANPCQSPLYLGETILKITQHLVGKEEAHDPLCFIITGYNKNALEILSASVFPTQGYPRALNEELSFAAAGSGGRFIGPALNRDLELGTRIVATDLAEGMLQIYDMAKTANKDLGVNDQLQLGMLGYDGSMRELFHPDIILSATPDYFERYIKQLTGIQLPKYKITETIWFESAKTAGEFYHSLVTELKRLNEQDMRANFAHTELKSGTGQRKAYRSRLADRARQKEIVMPLVQAFYDGSLNGIINTTRAFQQRVRESQNSVLAAYQNQQTAAASPKK